MITSQSGLMATPPTEETAERCLEHSGCIRVLTRGAVLPGGWWHAQVREDGLSWTVTGPEDAGPLISPTTVVTDPVREGETIAVALIPYLGSKVVDKIMMAGLAP